MGTVLLSLGTPGELRARREATIHAPTTVAYRARTMPGTNGRSGNVLALVGQEKDLSFYVHEAERRGAPVLVLGAGTGRVAWELANRGLSTLGVDPSEVMIETAEERRREETPEVSSRLRLVCADPRSLRLKERFPAVLAPHNALALMATLDDLDAMLATVRLHLAPDGAFVFDVLNPVRESFPPPDDPGAAWHPLEGIEPPRPIFAPHLRERVRSGDGISEGIRRLRLRHFTVAEVDRALEEAGFAAMERYGDFDRHPFEATHATQVVVAASRGV
jgi:SAM-dependent methyltransferase